METYLSDLERESIVKFNKDPIMSEAVKKVLLEGIYTSGVQKVGEKANSMNWVFNIVSRVVGEGIVTNSNEAIGEEVKAKVAGLSFLEEAFRKLSEYKSVEQTPVKAEVNPGE